MKLQIFITYVIFLCIVLGLLWIVNNYNKPPTIDTIWVINLDKETERLKNIQDKTKPLANILHRWQATYGKEERVDAAMADGVGLLMCTDHSDPGKHRIKPDIVNRNQGSVGCWLSHKRLLQHLASINAPNSWGHFIVEDDLDFPPNFMNAWEQRRHSVPADWDIIYLGIHKPKGHLINDKLLKAKTTNDTGNWGTHAYIVRHGSIKNRILPRLKYMSHDIDVQLNMHFDDLNVYIMEPALVKINKQLATKSSIELD